MDFTAEITNFPTILHRNIYCTARELTPVSHSLAGMTDEALKTSCLEYHGFVTDMLGDMYECPEAYHMPVGELDEFLGGKKYIGVMRKNPAKAEKLRSWTNNAVRGYTMLLNLMGQWGVLAHGVLTLTGERMIELEKWSDRPVSPIPLEKRLGAFARTGLVCEGGVFTSQKYPGMFPAMCALAEKAAGKVSGFGAFHFGNCEFRNIASAYKPTYEDYMNPLFTKQRGIADKIDAMIRKSGAKPQCNTYFKVDYKYKGMQVVCVESQLCDLVVRVTETARLENHMINDRLSRESDATRRYLGSHLWGCTGCSTSHLGWIVDVMGKPRRVCMGGGIGFRWTNPGEADLEYIKLCLGNRREIIDELKAKK